MKLRQMTNSFGEDRIAQHYKMLSKQFCPLRYVPFTCTSGTNCTSWVKTTESPIRFEEEAVYASFNHNAPSGSIYITSNGSGRNWYKQGASIKYTASQNVLDLLVKQVKEGLDKF